MSKNGEVSSNQGKSQTTKQFLNRYLFTIIALIKIISGPSRPTVPKPELNLFGTEKRKTLNFQLGGPSNDSAFVPFSPNPSAQKSRIPSRTIRDVLPENTR